METLNHSKLCHADLLFKCIILIPVTVKLLLPTSKTKDTLKIKVFMCIKIKYATLERAFTSSSMFRSIGMWEACIMRQSQAPIHGQLAATTYCWGA